MSSRVLDDDDDHGGIPLELDVDVQPAPAALPVAPTAPALELAPTHASAGASPVGTAPLIPPRSTPPEPTAAEVAALAAYGPAPGSLLQAPLYAVRVLRRRRMLLAEVRRKRSALATADLASEEELSIAMHQLRASAGPEHPMRELFESLSGHDAVADAAAGALEDMHRREQDLRARGDQEVASLGEERTKLEAALAEADAAAAAHREVHSRAEGRLKRAEIELRAAHDAARIAAGPDAKFAPPEHAVKIKELEAVRAERAQELAAAQTDYDRAVADTRAPRSALRAVRRRIAEIQERSQRDAREGRTAMKRTAASAENAQARRRASYAEAAREVLRLRPDDFPAANRAAMDRAEAEARRRARDLDLWVRTLDASDREGEQKGQLVLGAIVALILVVILILALR